MHRYSVEPRSGWQKRVEDLGLLYHTLRGEPYWDETACYQFTSYEIDQFELAAQTLHEMCLDLVQYVVQERMFGLFMIPPEFEEMVIRSWEEQEPSIYGRFDFAYDGSGAPKLLEYNADTPTALVEAAVAQWHWLKDKDEHGDQFNSIHERLIESWQALHARDSSPITFVAMSGLVEDYITVEYLRDTAIQAGIETQYLNMEQIGYNHSTKMFVHGNTGQPIRRVFKLYPWEWMLKEQFGRFIPTSQTRWVEPPWKMILSCKSILPLLWERNPDCPYLLPASFEPIEGSHVRKPIHAREGANIKLVVNAQVQLETDGPYAGPYVYQRLAPMKSHDGKYPVFGCWIVNGIACGMGIREDDSMITGNTSRFVPHQMVD